MVLEVFGFGFGFGDLDPLGSRRNFFGLRLSGFMVFLPSCLPLSTFPHFVGSSAGKQKRVRRRRKRRRRRRRRRKWAVRPIESEGSGFEIGNEEGEERWREKDRVLELGITERKINADGPFLSAADRRDVYSFKSKIISKLFFNFHFHSSHT